MSAVELPRYRVVKIQDGVRRGWWRVLRENTEEPVGVWEQFIRQQYRVVGEVMSLRAAHAVAREDAFSVLLEAVLRRAGLSREG